MTEDAPGAGRPGLRASIASLGTSLLGLAHTRLSLAAVEFDEERTRLFDRLLLTLVAVLCFAMAALVLSMLVVVWFWDTYRITALVAVLGAWLVAGGTAVVQLRRAQKAAPAPFAATLAELQRDREWIAGRAHEADQRGPE